MDLSLISLGHHLNHTVKTGSLSNKEQISPLQTNSIGRLPPLLNKVTVLWRSLATVHRALYPEGSTAWAFEHLPVSVNADKSDFVAIRVHVIC